ncbi:D-tagatose-bisphosphate aldolase, class II, non-catalytic subunit [Rhodovulum euryhalinum]|uniref:Tagatose-bisphosphate aldolase noncatalytic subunit n=1 Tax=Rhodovulum euryhalinum TaxID=35805 RepID=A0A4V2SA48_9RHOB|nr:D-tagatose-bisphosphate aldolase, class II, non-catalytic subunit [Rhodovulum euryhalinum]TCO70340.1 tagatose-bisphosphate aldolase noncatalytic subunit [Rhodovulum euryhalinum]
MRHPLLDIARAFHAGRPCGIPSVCSAHPLVIEAALRLARDLDRPALIEATCNQVNQEGGYTGMTPADFRRFVEAIAGAAGFDGTRLILGGDHLGPNPWKHLPADDAMARAEAMVAAYAAAGFSKLHLDTSMGCKGEPPALSDALTAERAARLAARAEAHRAGTLAPVYVIGTEVPVPGGAVDALDHLQVTEPAAVLRTHEVHRHAFAARGLDDAFGRVIALVVQPGVEFGHADVVHYDRAGAQALSQTLHRLPGLVFEAHSTDYQSEAALAALVEDGFAILKVGPWLTFALREALYGLDAVADVLDGHPPQGRLMATMDAVMRAAPGHWSAYYPGPPAEQWLQRHFSLSDRIRYYWPAPAAQAAVGALMDRLAGRRIPAPVLRQFLPRLPEAAEDAETVLIEAVQDVLRRYARAAAAGGAAPA